MSLSSNPSGYRVSGFLSGFQTKRGNHVHFGVSSPVAYRSQSLGKHQPSPVPMITYSVVNSR